MELMQESLLFFGGKAFEQIGIKIDNEPGLHGNGLH